ncbi:HPr family phosphocarrier protein [Blochmannia endosymbiont of Polyrhachis (Hedomyrma) turneri]|uniref:HPr family phosphocarrier protein n=1 Tax=Blochmannia endosymbiont of Polyrhachis (Hedomyrma) turneri TaxID=1505596 RepID=UPI00061A79E7|nr:HPr family phosphocarrier protein [Blochmannia endosymbiont of Polyrhachis (Hedomyrma) turneri]AKC60069.1 Phosphocarrier protein HPr [Blochmannia endosymbiont of Polyrhachis (Hedomyrma) turneri]
MYQKKIIINTPHGLHSRPAAKFVKEAKNFTSEITIISNNKQVSAKSLLKLQTLGLTQGSTILIQANGEDEKEAIQHLTQLIATLE